MRKAFGVLSVLALLLAGIFSGLGQEPAYQPFLPEVEALARAQAEAAAQAAAEAQAILSKAEKLLAELSVAQFLSAAEAANAQAQASVEACASAVARAEAEAKASAAACALALARARASVQACAAAIAEVEAAAQAFAQACASAQAQASASAAACAQAEAEVSAAAEAVVQAIAKAQAEAEASVQACAAALAEAKAYANAVAEALAQAESEAYAQAEAFSAAEVLAHAQACAQAAAQAQAEAEAASSAYAQAEAAAASGIEACAQAVAQAQAQALACAQAEAQAEAQVRVGVQAMAQALSEANASAYAAAEAAVSAYTQAVACAEAYASAQAEALAHAHAAALAQAEAEAQVAVMVEACATAQAEAAAAAYAAAAAFAGAQASAYACAQALAEARAEASSAAQACALALAQAQARASACAEARVAAFASANACAAARAQAEAMAQACAQAAATASTSVDVIPSIETSVQTFIDPECLRPTCEQYVPTAPGCPPTQEMSWDFGQVTAGANVNTTKSFPTEIANAMAALGVVSSVQVSSTLPAGLTFALNLERRQGTLSGTVPKEGGKWTVVYNLVDKNKCVAIRLTVVISTTAATAQCPPFTELKWDFGEVNTGTHIFTARAMPSDLRTKINSAGIARVTVISSNLPKGAALNLDLGQGIGVLTGNLPTAGVSYNVLFGLFDARGCEIFRLSVSLRTATARVPDLNVEIVRTAVEKVCEKDYSHAITVYWQASGGTAPIYVGPLSLIYPDGRTQMIMGTFPASGSAVLRANLSGGGKVKVRVQANDSAERTKTAEAEVELASCTPTAIGPIVIPLIRYTLEVYARRTIYVTPGYEELRLPFQIVGEEKPRTTPFSMSVVAGSKVTIEAPAQASGGAFGLGLVGFDVYVGDATRPTRYRGTYNRERGIYSLTLTISAKTKVIAVYEDIIG